MIARIWHRYTKPEHANAYESMLKPELLPGISKVKGYRGSYLLRREAGAEVEFITIMLWDSIDAIRAVAGEDYETAVIPEEQRKYSTTMLNRCITKSRQSTSPPRCHRFHSEDGYWRSHKPPRHSFPLRVVSANYTNIMDQGGAPLPGLRVQRHASPRALDRTAQTNLNNCTPYSHRF